MRKLFALALLAAFAPLGVAHAASPTPAPAKMAMKGKSKTPTKGKKSKMAMTKMITKGKMPMKVKAMPMRDSKTGRFMKKSTPAPMSKMTKK